MLFSYCSMFNFQDLPDEIRVAQEKKLEELKRQQELQNQLVVQRTLQFRDRKIKFFERRKIERMIRRLEKQQRSNGDGVNNNLSKLREDLEYVRFFPKNEKYVSLFTGGNSQDIVQERNKCRKQIKENLMAAAANGKDLEETASDELRQNYRLPINIVLWLITGSIISISKKEKPPQQTS
ncbi:hypothetical protein Zm00014a_038096 [Zea mays]|uniref:rRNA-processing protein EFG1 n=2 Tax=Zea mays TaxID=4577 RepID=A0A8J8YLZ1_MAIZE|nr:DUF2361 family protein [Zea mays]PWZ52285.1 hypothetical protein Zm00014a_038096 [Zea mays]